MATHPGRWFLSVCLLLIGPAPAKAAPETVSLAKDAQYRFLEGSDTTFRLKGANLSGKGASLALSVLNYFGTRKQITDGLAAQEAEVRRILRDSKMGGVLVYVEHQASMTDVQIKTLVSGKPQIIGAGIDQLSTWKAFNSNNLNAFKAKPTDGYRVDEDASYFLWASESAGKIEYGLTTPAALILNEARRSMSDSRLREEFAKQYDNDLRAKLVEEIERVTSDRPLRDQAKDLIAARQKALEEKRRIDNELRQALERAAKAEATAKVFDVIAQVLTYVQLARSLAADFPDSASDINKAGSTSDLRVIFEGIVKNSQSNHQNVVGQVQTYEDQQRNLRLQQMSVIRASKIKTEDIPGVLP